MPFLNLLFEVDLYQDKKSVSEVYLVLCVCVGGGGGGGVFVSVL